MIRLIPLGLLSLLLVAVPAHAATFREIVNGPVVELGDTVIALLYALAFVAFLFGVFKYFFSSGANAEENRTKGRQFMLCGLLGLVVLFSVWGLVKILLSVLTDWSGA